MQFFRFRWWWMLLSISVALFVSTSWLSATGAPDCGGPFPVISSLPYTDPGDTTTATTNTITWYPPSGSQQPYAAPELLYEIILGPTNFVTFTLSGQPGTTDHALFLLRSCGDGMALESFSQDNINDQEPEQINGRHYPAGTYYLVIDGFSGSSGYPRPGPYTLFVTGQFGFDGTPHPSATPTPTRLPTSTTVPTLTTITPTATIITPTATPIIVTPTATPSIPMYDSFLPFVVRPPAATSRF